jgi:antitoxin component YwqK of YwqJK toxin-antitoxin module
MVKYKKVPNNKNAIEIDGKVVLSFDPRYKKYLKWKDKNPELEERLIDNLEQEIENEKLYNLGAPHTGSNSWSWYNEDGKLGLESEMSGGKKDGEEKAYHDSGNLKSIFEYQNDVIHGKSKNWYDNGELEMEGNFKNGKKDGKCIFYFENGNKKWEGNYKDDIVYGQLIQYKEDGKIRSKENYIDGVLDGNYEFYHKNGNLRQSGWIQNYMKNGEIKSYWENGYLQLLENFKMGSKHGIINKYGIDGKMLMSGQYKNNYRHGNWTWYYIDNTCLPLSRIERVREGLRAKRKREVYEFSDLKKVIDWNEKGQKVSEATKSATGYGIWRNLTWYSSGVKKHDVNYTIMHHLHGKWSEWHTNGVKRAEGNMQYGMMQGKWIFWHHNRKKELECEFDFGRPVGSAKIYHDGGQLKEVVNF